MTNVSDISSTLHTPTIVISAENSVVLINSSVYIPVFLAAFSNKVSQRRFCIIQSFHYPRYTFLMSCYHLRTFNIMYWKTITIWSSTSKFEVLSYWRWVYGALKGVVFITYERFCSITLVLKMQWFSGRSKLIWAHVCSLLFATNFNAPNLANIFTQTMMDVDHIVGRHHGQSASVTQEDSTGCQASSFPTGLPLSDV